MRPWIVLAFVASCWGQTSAETPIQRFQVGVGGTYSRSQRLPEKNGFGGFMFAGSWAQNRLLRWTLSLDFDFAGSPIQLVPPPEIPTGAMAKLGQLLVQVHAGPEFTRHSGRVSLFVHALPGYTGWSLGSLSEGWNRTVSEGGFSLAAGGGMDTHLAKHFDLRIQGDYIPAWMGQGTPVAALSPPLTAGNSPYHNTRVTVVFMAVLNRR